MKKLMGAIAFSVILFIGTTGASAQDADMPRVDISGEVRRPQSLSMRDLARFGGEEVRVCEIDGEGNFQGVFMYRGVPLKHLLELAAAAKEDAPFHKLIDLAVEVRGANGSRALLSWGEIMYRQPSNAIIAYRAEPVMPQKDCSSCHKKGEFEKWRAPLSRTIALPRLVLAGDSRTGRSIEGVVSIAVFECAPSMPYVRLKDEQSPSIALVRNGTRIGEVKDLAKFPHRETRVLQVGDGKGFHGAKSFIGVPLAEVLAAQGVAYAPGALFVVSSPGGYRSVFSAGELFLDRMGSGIVLADSAPGSDTLVPGKFSLVFADDVSADRWVKAVDKIEMIEPAKAPMLYIVGVGCGDVSLLTHEAVTCMAKADTFVCTQDIADRFAQYMGSKPVLYDPLLSLANYQKKKNPGLADAEIKARVEEARKEQIKSLKDALAKDMTVAFLEYGDPTIYGSWTYWLYEQVPRARVKVIPGVSAFNAANAMIGVNAAVNGAVVLTVPDGIRRNEDLVRAAGKNGDTIAVFVGLHELKTIVPIFQKYYAADTPVIIAYKAGYARDGKLLKSTLAAVLADAEKEKEKFLGLIYVGPALRQ